MSLENKEGMFIKSANPKETNNPSSPNVIEKQKDSVSKPSNAQHRPTFDFPKQKLNSLQNILKIRYQKLI